ncbi:MULTISPECIES: DUF6233 domain-containing protein [unclassified Streptomyces]|uniref:DUF6233 domain-containing protein n=1 Tax=unclassified Streptomyces TaxID=2593676 RepID=UPI003523F117
MGLAHIHDTIIEHASNVSPDPFASLPCGPARHVGGAHRRDDRRGRAAGEGPATGRGARPTTPARIVELSIGVGARPVEVHVGGCYAARKCHRDITREQALAALVAFERRRAGPLARSHNLTSQRAARAAAPYLGAAALAMLPLRTG